MAKDKKKRSEMDAPPFFEHLRGAYEGFKRSAHVPEEAMLAYAKRQLSQETATAIEAHVQKCSACQELEAIAAAFAENEGIRSSVSDETVAKIVSSAKRPIDETPLVEPHPIELVFEGLALSLKQIAAWGSKILYEATVPGPGDFLISRQGKTVRFTVGGKDFTATPTLVAAKGHGKTPPHEGTDVTTFAFPAIGVEVRFVPSRKGRGETVEEAHFDIEVTYF